MKSILFLIISIVSILGVGIMAGVLSKRIGVTDEEMPISFWLYVAMVEVVEVVAYFLYVVEV